MLRRSLPKLIFLLEPIRHDLHQLEFFALNNAMNPLHISVIIASYNSRATIERCLKSLKNQKTTREFEVIVVDTSTDGTGDFVEKQFPWVKVRRFLKRKFAGGARNVGISIARGKIIALLDADCEAAEDWLEEIAKAHESPWPAVGGTIDNANPDSYVGWAAYFCEFGQWMPGTQSKYLDDIAGANMSYKRDVFDVYGLFITGTYCSDTHLHWRLAKNGHHLRFVPSITVSHHNIQGLEKFLKHEFFHGRCFARVRLRFYGFSKWKRTIYVVLSPLIAVKLFLKVLLLCFRNKNKNYLKPFFKSAPLVFLGILCWSLGETVVYAGLDASGPAIESQSGNTQPLRHNYDE